MCCGSGICIVERGHGDLQLPLKKEKKVSTERYFLCPEILGMQILLDFHCPYNSILQLYVFRFSDFQGGKKCMDKLFGYPNQCSENTLTQFSPSQWPCHGSLVQWSIIVGLFIVFFSSSNLLSSLSYHSSSKILLPFDHFPFYCSSPLIDLNARPDSFPHIILLPLSFVERRIKNKSSQRFMNDLLPLMAMVTAW